MRRGAVALAVLALGGCGGSESGTGAETATGTATGAAAGTATGAATETAAGTATGESSIGEGRFESAALGVTKRYRIYLPPGYEGGSGRFPVLYMLHGLGGDEDNWVDIGVQKTADEIGLGAIVVMPDGDDSFYTNRVTPADYDACMKGRRPFGRAANMKTYCVKRGRYEDYITRDLVAHIDATYRTVARREARAIAGLSMGGYGALMLSLRHPELFSIAVSHAGVASLLYDPATGKLSDGKPSWVNKGNRYGAHFLKLWGEDPKVWMDHDPTTLAKELEPGELALYLDCGTLDEFRLHLGAQVMHELLESKGIDHAFELVEGGHHNGAFWSSRIDDGLRFVKAHLPRG